MGSSREYDLSPSQRVVWYGQQLHRDHPIYNTAYAFHFQRAIDLEAFSRAHEKLVALTDSLRIVFQQRGERPKQRLLDDSPGALEIRKVASLDSQELDKALRTETGRALDIESCSWRSVLFAPKEGLSVWHFNQHHLLIDGLGFQRLLERMGQLYVSELRSEDRGAIPAYPSFADHLSQVSDDPIQRESEPSIFQITRYSKLFSAKPPSGSPLGERRSKSIDSATAKALADLATDARFASFSPELSLNLILLSSVFALLSRIEQQSSLTIGIANHGRRSVEEKATAGLFARIVTLSIELESDDTFVGLYDKVKEAFFEASRKIDSPISRQEYDVTFSFLSGKAVKFGDIPVRSEWLYPGCHENANRLRIHYVDTGESPQFTFDFNNEVFSDKGKVEFARCLNVAISAFANDPEQAVLGFALAYPHRDMGSFLESEDEIALSDLNLWKLFSETAHRHADSVAVESAQGSLTYRELREIAENLSQVLLEKTDLGQAVPIVGGRSIDMLVASLAAMRAGAAFLPIDSSLPFERIEKIKTDSGSKITLDLSKRLPISDGRHGGESRQAENAYLIYTSGSTGTPNGVSVGHRSVINLLEDMEGRAPLSAGSSCMWWTAVGFDVSIYEIFSAILHGNKLCIPPEDIRMDAERLFSWMQTSKIDSAYLPPFMLAKLDRWLDSHGNFPLKRLLVGVEPIQEELLCSISRKVVDLAIVNGYGPTEATVCATFYSIDPSFSGTRRTPIGRPVIGNKCYILDRALNVMPQGAIGELYISGSGLALGYWDRPELDQKRFLANPFESETGDLRMYKTGDLVRLSDEGELEFIGRADSQIKLRGQRIEPAEIEQTMSILDGISQCVARVVEIDGHDQLVCYYSGADVIDFDALIAHAAQHLPFQLIPKRFMYLEQFPTTANGKIDFERLPDPTPSSSRDRNLKMEVPESPVEEFIAETWSACLDVEAIGSNQSFFELGGNSIGAMEIVFKLSNEFELDLPIQIMFKHSTIRQLAKAIEEAIVESLSELSEEEAEQLLANNE